ncbi:MAG: ABC transporter permease subunit [Phycisphaerales bacterium]|nr:ABC transporter permease subunit [Phycisphaerales bacterium]
MNRVGAIAMRELGSYFQQPVGWFVVALYLALSGFVFSLEIYVPAQHASLRIFFASSVWIFSFVAPAVTMRLISAELRQGTFETLITSPVTDWEVILGKYLAAVAVLLVMLAPTVMYVVLLELVADLEYGPIAAGYLGLILLGMMYMALGVLTSAATESQMAAYLGALFFWLIVALVTTQGAAVLGEPWDKFLYACSPRLHMSNLAKGVVGFADIVYFLTVSAMLLVLAVKLLESRRWR